MRIGSRGSTRKFFSALAAVLAVFLVGSTMLAAIPGFILHAGAEEFPEGEAGPGILTPEDLEWIAEARQALQPIVQERDIMALVYLCDSYGIRESASADSVMLTTVSCGQTVNILDVEIVESGGAIAAWAKVLFYDGEADRQGYIERTKLACSDERFLAWEEEYGMNPAQVATYEADGEPRSEYADVEQFPESYREALMGLKEAHPQWIFVPMNTRLDWQTVINNEIGGGKSLVYKTLADCAKEGSYDGGNWYYASEDILKYYMDPRNALTENRIFQFELLTYNETYHTEEALEKFLNNTFMNSSKKAPGTDMTFAHIIWALGRESIRQVSPFHLAARIYQEQGQGTSPLISGTYPGFEGYYNYFNVGATGKSNTEYIVNGLTYAKEHNWYSAYFSIQGGADLISANYIRKGQDTLYLEKFNVNPSSAHALYTHQYMQNISAPATEGSKIKELYVSANSLENTFVFKIPVFNNMPDSACAYPTGSTNIALSIPGGYDTAVWLDGVQYTPYRKDGSRVIVKAGNGNAKSAVVYKYDKSGVPTGMYVWTLQYANNAYRVTAQPELTNLLSYDGFSIRITGKSGIRFKTGIDKSLKEKLARTGINGYKLKEYGTLAMNNANRDTYPMILKGQKVVNSMAYGPSENGQLEDFVFETVNGRQKFTSVLIDIKPNLYKTDFAFRGYLILEKDGEETIIYGPARASNIYLLAERIISRGDYPEGSEQDIFVKKLIEDANS